MFCHKKIVARGNDNREKPIDFLWLQYIGVNKLGFTYRSIGRQYFGLLMDLFETFKKQYNFEMRRGLYKIFEMEAVSSLDAI